MPPNVLNLLRKVKLGGFFGAWLSWFATAAGNDSLTLWAKYWLFWFFGVFLVPELYWAHFDARNTVSDNTWRFESLDAHHPFDFSKWTAVHWSFAVVYIVFMAMLGAHLIFGTALFGWRR